MGKLAFSNIIFSAAMLAGSVFTAFAATGPVGMPGTLLSMYGQSDSIVVANYERTERGELIREDRDYRVTAVKQFFEVTSVLKGTAGDHIVLVDEDYQAPGSFAPASINELKNGDTVLLFLRKNQNGALELTEAAEGMKNLSARDLAVYERRIADLGPLFADGSAKPEDIAEWLVRCAEDPATRWDAAFELVKSFERKEWQRRQAEKNKIVNIPDTSENLRLSISEIALDPAAIAKAVTSNQKQAIANILFNRIYLPKDQSSASVRGDRELTDLVKLWGDPRLVRLLVDELRDEKSSPYRISEALDLLAEIVDDPCVRRKAADLKTMSPGETRTAAIRDLVTIFN